jgi:hypothetical protein
MRVVVKMGGRLPDDRRTLELRAREQRSVSQSTSSLRWFGGSTDRPARSFRATNVKVCGQHTRISKWLNSLRRSGAQAGALLILSRASRRSGGGSAAVRQPDDERTAERDHRVDPMSAFTWREAFGAGRRNLRWLCR